MGQHRALVLFSLAACLVMVLPVASSAAPPAPSFIRGDVNGTDGINIADPIFLLGFLFLGGESPPCEAAADSNKDNALNIVDSVYLLNFLFSGGPPPVGSYPECDFDFDFALSCNQFPDACTFVFDEFESIRYAYDTLSTVAGAGNVATNDVNNWEGAFEGGQAADAELSKPHVTLADADGNLYVVDKESHAVRKVDPGGIITTLAGTNAAGDGDDAAGPATERALNEPNGLWISDSGIIYVLDTGNDKVRRIEGGMMATMFEVSGLRTGRGLWVAEDESHAYVASRTELLVWTPEEGVSVYASGFAQLGNFVVEHDGRIAVTDRDAHLVYRLAPDGIREVIAGNGTTTGGGDGDVGTDVGLDQVRGIWPAPEFGGYFLATQRGSQIWYLGGDGIMRLFLDGSPDGAHAGDGENYMEPGAKVSNIRSVTADRNQNLLITEHDAGYVRKIQFFGIAIP